jgi:polyhydroxybutyrate depolymerase
VRRVGTGGRKAHAERTGGAGRRRTRWAVLALSAAAALVAVGRADSRAAEPPLKASRPRPPKRAVVLPGRPAQSVDWVTTTGSVAVDGVTYRYRVTRPAVPGPVPLPVVMVLHGQGASPALEEARTGFPTVTGPAVLVYPTGYDASWNAGFCCGAAYAAQVNDAAGLVAVLDAVWRTEPEASRRAVYLAGYSNGGKMALTLACRRPDLFRAVAVYGATAAAPCVPTPPMSVLELAGTKDPEVTVGPAGPRPMEHGFAAPTVVGEADTYAAADRCEAPPTTAAAGSLRLTVWSRCADGRRVALGLYLGGTHTWPDGGGGTPSAAAVMWAFFRSLGA